jgi:hypothetical protein
VARDAGAVSSGTTPSFDPQGLVGWVSVTNSGTGQYCLTPDATSTEANTSLLVSLGGPGGGSSGFVFWEGYCSFNPLELWVLTDDTNGAASNGIRFEAVIPATP